MRGVLFSLQSRTLTCPNCFGLPHGPNRRVSITSRQADLPGVMPTFPRANLAGGGHRSAAAATPAKKIVSRFPGNETTARPKSPHAAAMATKGRKRCNPDTSESVSWRAHPSAKASRPAMGVTRYQPPPFGGGARWVNFRHLAALVRRQRPGASKTLMPGTPRSEPTGDTAAKSTHRRGRPRRAPIHACTRERGAGQFRAWPPQVP